MDTPRTSRMAPFVVFVTILSFAWLVTESKGMICYMIQELDPDSDNIYRWVIPVQDPCLCTQILVGGLSIHAPLYRPFKVTYYDNCLQSSDITEIQTWLDCSSTKLVNHACSFVTEPLTPHSFTFILKPLTMPFRLTFKVKCPREALVAMAEDMTEGSIFAEINIGGWWNSKSAIRPCHSDTCSTLLSVHDEVGIVSGDESRPFWIEYKEGVVTVGKGGHQFAFLEWNVSALHQPVPARVHIGVGSWQVAPAEWVFYEFCE